MASLVIINRPGRVSLHSDLTTKDMGLDSLDKVAIDVDVGHRRKCSRPVAPSARKLGSRAISMRRPVKMARLNTS